MTCSIYSTPSWRRRRFTKSASSLGRFSTRNFDMRSASRATPGGLVLIALVVFGAGCTHTTKQPIGYWGVTEPMSKVVAQVNANNSAIPTLYARQEIQAALYDKSRNKSFYVNSSGDVFLRKPRELLLRGRHD